MSSVLTFADLLDLLGHDEKLAVCTQPAGGKFHARIVTAEHARSIDVPQDVDCWFSVNPLRADKCHSDGRGTAADVTRLAALYADLDAKDNGVGSIAEAHNVIDDISMMLGSRPVAITYSGHGLQPYWAIEDDITGPEATATIRRFGRLVHRVAATRGKNVDSVYDLARVLRVPGTQNHKSDPRPVTTFSDTGHALSREEITECFDAYAIPAYEEDHTIPGAALSAPDEWEYVRSTCLYVTRMVTGWATEAPSARHPWLVSQATRIAAAHRLGCLDEHGHRDAIAALTDRFAALIAGDDQRPKQDNEVAEALKWGQDTISAKSDDAVRRELGNHQHPSPILTLVGSTPQPAVQHATDGNTARVIELASERTIAASDDGNAQALVARYGEVIRYSTDRGRWYTWTGRQWELQPSKGGAVREYAKTIARDLPRTSRAEEAWQQRSLSALGITNTLTSAESDPRITVTLADFDTDPWALNTPGGVVDLRTGTISESAPAGMHTRITACTPDSDADASAWLGFLADTFNNDDELIGYMQRLFGYSATGFIGPHILPFAYGLGGNGKGVALETVTGVLGDYATTSPNGFLMAHNYAQHETEIARLSGARMVLCSEVNERDRFDEAKIKQLTGGDTLTARFMRQDHFTFKPTHHLWLMGNHKPAVTSGGDSFWRRCRLIPFVHKVPAAKMIDGLQDRLVAEHGPAILAWVIEGAAAFYRDGLQEPASVAEATAAYAHDQDTVARFVEESCHLAPGSTLVQAPSADINAAYLHWCDDNGETPVSAKRLISELATRFGVEKARSNGRRMLSGICIFSPEGDGNGAL